MKKFLFNAMISTVIWTIFNGFFFLLIAFADFYKHSHFGILLNNPQASRFQMTVCIITIILVVCWGTLCFYIGKKLLQDAFSIQDYISVFIFHPIILLLIYLSVQSESTMITTINWFVQTITVFSKNSNLCDSFLINALLTLYPYLCILGGGRRASIKGQRETTVNQENQGTEL